MRQSHKKKNKKSSVTAKGVKSAGGRQRSVYKGATDFETAPPSSLPPSAACEASSLRFTGNLVFVCIYTVPFSDSFKTLGVLLDSSLSMGNFFSQTSKSCYYQLLELVLSGSIFSPKLRWNWMPSHSFCHTSTTDIFSFLVCLLPLSIAFVAFRTVLFALYWK